MGNMVAILEIPNDVIGSFQGHFLIPYQLPGYRCQFIGRNGIAIS